VRVQLESREGEEEISFCCRNPTAAPSSGNVPTTRRKRPGNERRREKERRRREVWITRRKDAPPTHLSVAGAFSPAAEIVSSTAAHQAAAKGAAEGTAASGAAASGAAASGAATSGAATSGAAASAAATGAEATGAAATRAAVIGAAATGTGASGGAAKEVEAIEAAAGGAAPPAKRLKATMGVSRASARYAVVSKRRDGCLLGSSVTESPEKLRGYHEIIDSFIIEYEDDKLHREEGVETEPETEEGSETKEDEGMEPFQGNLPTTSLASPRRLTCSCCLEVHRDLANSLCTYCGFKLL
jgi:hypothetical protein